jgi:hypothetical protein
MYNIGLRSVELLMNDGGDCVLGHPVFVSERHLRNVVFGIALTDFFRLFICEARRTLTSALEHAQGIWGKGVELFGVSPEKKNIGNGNLVDTEAFTEFTLCESLSSKKFANFIRLIFRKLGGSAASALALVPGLIQKLRITSLACAIYRIIAVATKEQVVGVDASWVVALMKNVHVIWDRTLVDRIGDAVSKYYHELHDAVFHGSTGSSTSPEPAVFVSGFSNSSPEGFDLLLGKWRDRIGLAKSFGHGSWYQDNQAVSIYQINGQLNPVIPNERDF